jgi:hypothetical protein
MKKLFTFPIAGLLFLGLFQTALASAPNNSNIFDIHTVKVGDRVAGMEVVSVQPENSNFPLSVDNVRVKFRGEATVKGTYEYTNEGLLEGLVCMTSLDPASQAKLPQMKQLLDRPVWFCFENNTFAQTQFAPPGNKGTAEIVIRDYNYVSLEADVWDSAVLVKVLGKN